MNRVFVSIVLVIGILAVLLIVNASRSGTQSVYIPSQLLKLDQNRKWSRIRVGGKVRDPIEYSVQPVISLKFAISDPGTNSSSQSIQVIYDKPKPDMFAVGRDVIIDGEYEGGVITATQLLTQCPSKYEPPSAEKKYGTVN